MNQSQLEIYLHHKIVQALEFENEGKNLHALQIYTSLIEEYPEFEDAYYLLAELHKNSKNKNLSLQVLEKLIDFAPLNSKAKLFYVNFLLEFKEFDKLSGFINQVDEKDDPAVVFFKGFIAYKMDKFEDSIKEFKKYLQMPGIENFKDETLILLSKIFTKIDRPNDALEYLNKVEVIENNFEFFLYRGICSFLTGSTSLARQDLEKALKLNEKDTSVYEWLGEIYLFFEQYQKLVDLYNRFMEKFHATPGMYVKLGISYLNLKKYKEAEAYLKSAIQIDPENKDAVKTLELLNNKMRK
ncbi:MAG: tetratricopeptide repeat protein [Ignavibacteriaceae bacterium]|nr:tetratricopeptide repeat protein [Ignavibacteriaceae bacterium]